jgi:DnaJ-class molecular chaperone
MVKHKEPCPDCQGNGYRRIWKDTSEVEKITIQCSTCDSEGEIEILSPESLRENGVI